MNCGGDRPAPFDPYSFLAGQRVQLDAILSHVGHTMDGGKLTWKVSDASSDFMQGGVLDIDTPLNVGRPQMLGRIVFDAPHVETAIELRLELALEADGKTIANWWRLWVFPAITQWPENIGIYDPAGSLHALDDLRELAIPITDDIEDVSILLTSELSDKVLAFLRDGGRVVLLQSADKPLPALGVPFWREGIKIICDHPAMNALPHNGYADLQFYGLASEWAFDTGKLAEILPELGEVRPLLRRLDARQFTTADYLIDVQVGKGRLMASTLRFQGGTGDQPAGLRHHPAGRWLLYSLLKAVQ